MTDTSVCVATIDTEIDASAQEVHSAADWLEKLQTGFSDADTDLCDSSTYWTEISGEFGQAVEDYATELSSACDSASDELGTFIDVIHSWGDQITWRKEDMAGYRDEATQGGLTVSGMLIEAPYPVGSPGELAKDATAAQKTQWEADNTAYEAYLKKVELFNRLSGDVQDVRDKLTTWAETNMVVSGESPLFEVAMEALSQTASQVAQNGIENAYLGAAYYSLVKKATPGATARAAAASGNPKVQAGKQAPKSDNVARRAQASAASKMGPVATAASRAATAGGVVLSLAMSGWEISQGDSPSSVAVKTVAGAAGGAAAVAAVGAVATALTLTTAPAWLLAAAAIAGGTVAGIGARWAYESLVPLRTREKIDEGLRDAGSWVSDKATSAWRHVFG
ncbi:hypothetical protein [Actinomyces wuliandei]|uniref:hypothetical protein n=1 Tax=Actinomyces wuliandei TaxID=2057743 RepID=UPI0013E3CBF8|nr:hypothetical protein [Actinomyces wuliandei]